VKISIITPSFNQGRFIEQNILSVLNQNYPNFEHIVVDGGSTDDTLVILKKYPHLKWISEKDEGQADALNKGFKMSSGEIIGWLNADDYYLPNTFNKVAMHFLNKKVKWIVGNIRLYFLEINKMMDCKSPRITYQSILTSPDIVKQQGTFFRRSILVQVGGWNKKYFMVMDFDLWLRLSKITPPKMVDDYFAVFVIHSHQKTNPKNIIRQTKEIIEILRMNKASVICIGRIVIKKINNLLRYLIKLFLIKIGFIEKDFENIPWRTIKKL